MTRLRAIAFVLLVLPLLALAGEPAPPADSKQVVEPADLVVVLKGARTLYLYRDGLPIRSYHIGLGDHPRGDKHREGDERTPEGAYILDWRNPESIFYKSLHISYPNSQDLHYALSRGWNPGGNIMIHGQPNYATERRVGDWTDGCIAVSNRAMDEIWRLVPDGTRIHIYP